MRKVPSSIKEKDLYKVNLDFTGQRQMTDSLENVEFHFLNSIHKSI